MRSSAWNGPAGPEKRPRRIIRLESDSSDGEHGGRANTAKDVARAASPPSCPGDGVVFAFRAGCGVCGAKSEQVFELPVASATARLVCASDCKDVSKPGSTTLRKYFFILGGLAILVAVGLAMVYMIGMDPSKGEWPSLDGALFLGW
ncbi:hypothetical protein LX36DRAFT_702742 [Colletotrichum falcatum]|nr:hypothetical protein LX36DRAFT_702742 [Colletotrichum falcatum]